MTKGLTEPHILLASSNPQKLIKNLVGIFTTKQLAKIQRAVDSDVCGLLELGIVHYDFAIKLDMREWRQRTSRLYYAAYNVKRAVQLKDSGIFSTDSSDHQRIDVLPDAFPNAVVYRGRLKNMRDDRNLADYSHLASEMDLLINPTDMQTTVEKFIIDAKAFLNAKGMTL